MTFGTFVAYVVKTNWNNFNKQALRTVLNSTLDYETLLRMIGSLNIESSRVQNMLVTTCKTLYGVAPLYLRYHHWKKEKRRTTSEVP